MCQWRFAKHFTGFLPLPMRDMCTFDTALSLRWETATTESFSHVNERKGKTSRKTRRRTKRGECFSCCMTLLRLLAKADCENPEKKEREGDFRNRRSWGIVSVSVPFTSQLPVVEKARKASSGQQESESYMARLPFSRFFLRASWYSLQVSAEAKAIPMWPRTQDRVVDIKRNWLSRQSSETRLKIAPERQS